MFSENLAPRTMGSFLAHHQKKGNKVREFWAKKGGVMRIQQKKKKREIRSAMEREVFPGKPKPLPRCKKGNQTHEIHGIWRAKQKGSSRV